MLSYPSLPFNIGTVPRKDYQQGGQGVRILPLYFTMASLIQEYPIQNLCIPASFLLYDPAGSSRRITLEVRFDDEDPTLAWIPLLPGTPIDIAPATFTKLSIRAIKQYGDLTDSTSQFIGRLFIAPHPLSNGLGSHPDTAIYVRPPTRLMGFGNAGLVVNPGGGGACAYKVTISPGPEGVVIANEMEIKNIGTSTVFVSSIGVLLGGADEVNLYPLGAGEKETFWAGATPRSSLGANTGTGNSQALYVYSGAVDARIAYKTIQYR
jgi:hypothetical protein